MNEDFINESIKQSKAQSEVNYLIATTKKRKRGDIDETKDQSAPSILTTTSFPTVTSDPPTSTTVVPSSKSIPSFPASQRRTLCIFVQGKIKLEGMRDIMIN